MALLYIHTSIVKENNIYLTKIHPLVILRVVESIDVDSTTLCAQRDSYESESVLDDDECELTTPCLCDSSAPASCEAYCWNEPGTYSCDCQPGYHLNTEDGGHVCSGNVNPGIISNYTITWLLLAQHTCQQGCWHLWRANKKAYRTKKCYVIRPTIIITVFQHDNESWKHSYFLPTITT